jgi:hypothetical protein
MVSWPWQPGPGSRRCDAPDCQNDSIAKHCLVLRPAIGPVLDAPLRLCFCDEHGDAASLVDRYQAWQRSTARREPVTPGTREPRSP